MKVLMVGAHYAALLILCCCLLGFGEVTAQNVTDETRAERVLSLFQVVKFPNDMCVPSDTTRNGTCYTASECSSKGGTASGSCASGYGVCCIFVLGCGQSSSENCTYFASAGTEVGDCTISICPTSDNICQLRLDFNSFLISQPSTSVTTSFKTIGGIQQMSGSGPGAMEAGQCQNDIFLTTSPGNPVPPGICGSNTGQHMIVGVTQGTKSCNNLQFSLTSATVTVSRAWNIKVTQFACDYIDLAPDGCTKYYSGPLNGILSTYNYASGVHLANQKDNICIRKERNMCQICYSVRSTSGFDITGGPATVGGIFQNQAAIAACCSYAIGANAIVGYDCLVFPGAEKVAGTDLGYQAFCGADDVGIPTASPAAITAQTLCSSRVPFQVHFFSDGWEQASEVPVLNKGVELVFQQKTC